jgi:hypothetical protein
MGKSADDPPFPPYFITHFTKEIKRFLGKPLLVVAHSGFHQQTRDSILHLHHLAHQQVR